MSSRNGFHAHQPAAGQKAGGSSLKLLLSGAVILLLVVAVLCAQVSEQYSVGWDFRVNLWGPAHLLVNGRSPYETGVLSDVDPLFTEVTAVWFPPASGFFFYVGWLDAFLASDLWLVGNILLILVISGWFRGKERIPPVMFATIPLVLVLFSPLLTHLILGQFSLLAVFLLLLATRCTRERRYFLAGLAVVLVLSKPQLGVLALPGLCLAAFRGGGRRGGILLTTAAVAGAAVLTLPFWIGYPAWVPDFLQVLRENPFWYQPTLYTNLQLLWGQAGWILPGLLSLGLFGLNLWLWWKYPPEEVMPWSLALTTLASPYIWTWDFVLFLPLILRSLFRQRSRLSRVIWVVGVGLCFGLMTWLRLTTDNRHHRYFWVPWLVFLLVLGTHLVESRRLGVGRQPLLERPSVQGR